MNNQLIIDCMLTHYGIDVLNLSLLPIGADMNAAVYKAQARDQTPYFVKLIGSQDHTISVVIIELLKKNRIHQIIPPIKTISGTLTQRIEDFTLIVYPFVHGHNGFSHKLTDRQWVNLGRALNQIHQIEVPASIQKQLRRESFSPKWREALRALYPHIEASELLKGDYSNIRMLVDRAEELAQKLKGVSPKFVLCHSDIHGGNVLMDGNNSIYIVDWDDSIMAPKERDLMFMGGGVGNVWNDKHEEELFYEGYGNTEVDPTILAYYRLERIVEDTAIYAQELLLGSPKNKQEILKHYQSMFEPNGVVEIAFKTYDQLSH